MNSVTKIETVEAWAVEERMPDGRWRVPRYAGTGPTGHPAERRDEYWEDGEYRAWTFNRSLVRMGIVGWLDEYEVGSQPVGHGNWFQTPRGGIFCNRHRLANGGKDSWERLCAAYPGAARCHPIERPNIGGVLPKCCPDDPYAICALLDGAKAKGWFDA
jgi:hypothetical protein